MRKRHRKLAVDRTIRAIRLVPCVGAMLLAVTAGAEAPDVMESNWTRLVFETSKPIAALRIDIRLALATCDGPCVENYLLSSTVTSDVSWPFRDAEFRGVVRFRRRDGAAVERVRERMTGGRYRKSYVYSQDAVTRIKLRPSGRREENQSPEQWSDRSELRLAYPADRDGCETIVDPTLLLLAASSSKLLSGETGVDLCVFNKKRLHSVQLRAVGTEQIEIRERIVSVRRIEIHATPRAGPFSPEPLEFMGIEGDFEILIDERTSLPVGLRGRVDVFGRADFRLTEFELEDSSP